MPASRSIEGRSVLDLYDRRMDEFIVYSATQFPHIIRRILAQSLGIRGTKLRVVAPDVGGGFGVKNNFNPEEFAVVALAIKLGERCVRSRTDARILLRRQMRASTAMTFQSIIAGPSRSAPTSLRSDPTAASDGQALVSRSKPSSTPWRVPSGATRSTFAWKPWSPPSAIPYRSAAGKLYNSGDYPGCTRQAIAAIDLAAVRERQARGQTNGRLIGAGMASYTE
jgi:carbon-monoxide dehydrogenase large subunit